MAQSTGLQFTVKVGALADSTFAVASFKLDEGLNRPFNLHLEVASSQPDIDFGAVLDQPCELLVWYNGELQRRVCGVVSEFAQGDSGFRRTRYSIEVKPALWRLGLRQNSRIFQAQKPDEILSILLQEHGITDYAFALKNEHAQREYCVQYRETDLDFVNRLAAEEGLFYFHEFEAGKHRIVFADDAAALTAGPELFFNLGNRSLEQGAYVRQFHYRESVRPSDVELKDYSFKTPAYGLSHKKVGAELEHQRDTYQHFDYPGRYKQDPSGKAFAQHRLDALRNDAVAGSGKSNSAALLPGQYFSLTEHPNVASPLITENCVIATFNTDAMPHVHPIDAQAYQDASAYAKMRVAQGWAKGVVSLASHSDATQLGYLNVRPRPLGPITGSQSGGHRNIRVDVVLHRVVEGEYSRLPLHMMVEAARDAGVPFNKWVSQGDNAYRLDSALSYPTVNLAKLDELWVDAAKRRGEVINLARNLPDEVYQKLRQSYLHYSADTGLVNKPNRVGDKEVRKLTGNQKGGY